MSKVIEKFVKLSIFRYRNKGFMSGEDIVVKEVPITLFLNGKEFVTLVCSPGDLKELAVGFLCSEGILQKKDDLKELTINEIEGLVQVTTTRKSGTEAMFLKRVLASGCGRSRASFYFVNDAGEMPPITSTLKITPEEIFFLSEELEAHSSLFKDTGGVHNAALCSKENVVVYYEDIGRHNAVDKILGRCFLENLSTKNKILVFSGRIASEILIKVAKMSIPLLISRSAPTQLALKLAEDLGITVVGFARKNRLNVYTHPDRIVGIPRAQL